MPGTLFFSHFFIPPAQQTTLKAPFSKLKIIDCFFNQSQIPNPWYFWTWRLISDALQTLSKIAYQMFRELQSIVERNVEHMFINNKSLV